MCLEMGKEIGDPRPNAKKGFFWKGRGKLSRWGGGREKLEVSIQHEQRRAGVKLDSKK